MELVQKGSSPQPAMTAAGHPQPSAATAKPEAKAKKSIKKAEAEKK